MLPRLDASVTPVKPADGVGAAVPVGDGRQAAFQRAIQNLVGQTVSAEVIAKLKDGSYLVKVADNAVRMNLPGDTQVGHQVPLTVLSAQPRPTFQLGNAAPGSAPTVLYTETAAAEGGEAATLPSQGAATYVPGGGKAASGAPAAQTPAQAPAPGGAAAESGANAGTGSTTGNATPTTGAPAAGNPATNTRPGLPAGAAATLSTAEPPEAAGAQPARPGVAGNAAPAPADATPQPAATAVNGAATLPAAVASNPAATPNPAATQAAAAGQPPPGGAAPADGAKPPSLAATLLGKAPLTPSHELPELGANTPQATLSSAARVLTNVLSTAMAGQAGQMAQLALIGKTALFGNAAPDTAELANKLQDTVSKSGLFYESHVAEWVKGERPLADLMREPQMQRLLQQGQESAARAAAGGPDLSAAQMINQQLHTHEQSRVLWNGQAWPGQPMQWEVRRDAREGGKGGGQSDAETEPVWHSGVRFRLPLLGAVSAAVTLIGEQVHIQVQADNAGSADTLRAWAGQLESALAAAGAQLSSLRIDQDDEVAP